MAIFWWHWGETLHIYFSGLQGDRDSLSQYGSFTHKMVLKIEKAVSEWLEEGSSCSLFRSPGDRAFKPVLLYGRYSWKGSLFVTLGKPLYFIVQVFWERELWWVNTIVLLETWFWKHHSLVTLGKIVDCSGHPGYRAFSQQASLLGRWSWMAIYLWF